MDFVEIAQFGSRLEAETIGHALDQYGIPFLVKSEAVGIFGPGADGPTLVGATLWVPSDRVDEVAGLLTCIIRKPGIEESGEPLVEPPPLPNPPTQDHQ